MTPTSNRTLDRPDPCRSLARRLLAAFGAASVALVMSSACGDDPASDPPVTADAGPPCERGTRNCACIGGSGCQDDLLCIAGRCSLTQDGPDEPAPPRPRPPPDLDLPEIDAGNQTPPAGDADGGAVDASVPDDGPSTPTPDAGDDAG